MNDIASALSHYAENQYALTMTPFHRMVEDLVHRRTTLKTLKKWAEADEIRDKLQGYGFHLQESKHDTYVTIPGTNHGWVISTNLKRIAGHSPVESGFVPYEGPPIDTEAEAKWYRQEAQFGESN